MDAFALAEWLLGRLGADERTLPRAIGGHVLALLSAIGSSLSQWAANLYLDGLDHFVKRELKVRGYLRYMTSCCSLMTLGAYGRCGRPSPSG